MVQEQALSHFGFFYLVYHIQNFKRKHINLLVKENGKHREYVIHNFSRITDSHLEYRHLNHLGKLAFFY